MRPSTLYLLLILTIVAPVSVSAYEVSTHRDLALRAAAAASDLHRSLIEDLGQTEGRDTVLRSGVTELSVAKWLQYGAGEEDQPFWRVRHHFHDPLRAWDSAGLSTALGVEIEVGQSSIVWSQRAVQEGSRGGGTWSWPSARQRFLAALTGRTPTEREAALADTFRALGHVTHFIQDATVPAHVRNDMHLWLPFGNDHFFPLNPDWYEDWVQDTLDHDRETFDGIVGQPPIRPLRLVFHSEHPEAPIPIAGLIDTDQYGPDGPAPSVFGPEVFGVAELTNSSFVSRDTIFTGFPRPLVSDLGPSFFEPDDDALRQYFPKVVRGTTVGEIEHFVVETALAHYLSAVRALAPPSTLWTLDHRVLGDYARALLPRAIGYSAELLDYFFRGRLDVDVTIDPLDAALVRLTGRNASPEPLYDGTLGLYADTVRGERVAVPALDPVTVIGIAPGETLLATRFEAPPDTERFIAVYQGTLGLERKTETFPGAVIGKVMGGVRVEEVFADGPRWRLRTPVGVFDLPLATGLYSDVTWGDGDDVLVARTPLRNEPPGFVATYEIARRAGSVEPVTSGVPAVVELRPQGLASSTFASAPLVTTIAFDETIEHRQQIGRWLQEVIVRWKTPANVYETVSVTRTPVVFETLYEQTVSFARTIPVRLDPAHNWHLGAIREPYFWDLVDVAVDRSGRILGLVAIFLTEPGLAPVSVPWYRLDSAGAPFVGQMLRFDARFPADATTIWALVDLDAGAVVASTTEPTVTFSIRRASEGPPWDSGGAGSSQFPGVYWRQVTRYHGGDQDGQVTESWITGGAFSPRSSSDGLAAEMETTVGERSLAVTGWFEPVLRDTLERSGFATFQAGEVARSTRFWNYVCVTTPCAADGDYAGFAVTSHRGDVIQAPARLVDARRARPAPLGERLVLLGDVDRHTVWPIGTVIAWDIDARRAREAFRVPPSRHPLGPQASTSAVLLSYRHAPGPAGTFLIGLDDGAVESFFADEDLAADFALLPPARLYSVRDFRFYRGEPPLQPTALPARLSPLPANPLGDYHVIGVP